MRWIDGLEELAAGRLPEPVHRYFRQGSAGGISVAEAVDAWNAVRFRPQVLTDVSRIDLGTTVAGTPIDVPVLGGADNAATAGRSRWRGGDGGRDRCGWFAHGRVE